MSNKTRTHIVFPAELLDAVDRLVGSRGRSKFLVEAAREKVSREEFLKALEEASGAWTDENHPELNTEADVTRYIKELRETYRERTDSLREVPR